MQNSFKRTLLPLNALRVFEVAARHLSFTKAAKELNVTQGAVSRQIKHLESQLQMVLFHRLHRQLVLTDQGQILLTPLTEALDKMSDIIDKLSRQDTYLNLKVHPTFAIRWLIPRLYKFQGLHPEIKVRFSTSNANVDFKREIFDVGITYRAEKTEGVNREKIMDELLTPVCSPDLLNQEPPLEKPEDLKHHVLLHNNPDQREWRSWAKMIGLKDLPFGRGQFFDVDDAAIQAATTGLGIALGELFLIKKDIVAGRLVAPFKNSEVKTGDYHLAWHEANDNKSSIMLFREWLLHEISQPSTT